MATKQYEVVGAIERHVGEHFRTEGDTILVDDGDDELLIAQPKTSAGDDDE
jgi:hypothetical protein